MLRIFEKSANADVVEEESTDTDSRVKDSRILRVNIKVRQGSSAIIRNYLNKICSKPWKYQIR